MAMANVMLTERGIEAKRKKLAAGARPVGTQPPAAAALVRAKATPATKPAPAGKTTLTTEEIFAARRARRATA